LVVVFYILLLPETLFRPKSVIFLPYFGSDQNFATPFQTRFIVDVSNVYYTGERVNNQQSKGNGKCTNAMNPGVM